MEKVHSNEEDNDIQKNILEGNTKYTIYKMQKLYDTGITKQRC